RVTASFEVAFASGAGSIPEFDFAAAELFGSTARADEADGGVDVRCYAGEVDDCELSDWKDGRRTVDVEFAAEAAVVELGAAVAAAGGVGCGRRLAVVVVVIV